MYFITGTDTNIGKTLIAAIITYKLGGIYWKPIQAGDLQTGGDTQRVKDFTCLSEEHFLPPVYALNAPVSPHEAARRDNITIDIKTITPPASSLPLIIEGAGGLMVPLNDTEFMIDLIKQLGFPVILVCRSSLGTLNHTLLSLKVLKDYDIPVKGLVMNGENTPHTTQALEYYGNAKILGEIPFIEKKDFSVLDCVGYLSL